MAIQKLIQDAAFDADVVKVMVDAYETARLALEFPSGETERNRQIAECVMRITKDGERDPQVIAKRAVMEIQNR